MNPEEVDLGLYILDGHTPVHVTDTMEWGHDGGFCHSALLAVRVHPLTSPAR